MFSAECLHAYANAVLVSHHGPLPPGILISLRVEDIAHDATHRGWDVRVRPEDNMRIFMEKLRHRIPALRNGVSLVTISKAALVAPTPAPSAAPPLSPTGGRIIRSTAELVHGHRYLVRLSSDKDDLLAPPSGMPAELHKLPTPPHPPARRLTVLPTTAMAGAHAGLSEASSNENSFDSEDDSMAARAKVMGLKRAGDSSSSEDDMDEDGNASSEEDEMPRMRRDSQYVDRWDQEKQQVGIWLAN